MTGSPKPPTTIAPTVAIPSVYSQPPPKPLKVAQALSTAPIPASLPPAATLASTLPVLMQKNLNNQMSAPSVFAPKPYPLTLSVTSLITSTSATPTTAIDTRLYPVSRTPSITSQRSTKPISTTDSRFHPVLRTPSIISQSRLNSVTTDARLNPVTRTPSIISQSRLPNTTADARIHPVTRTPSLISQSKLSDSRGNPVSRTPSILSQNKSPKDSRIYAIVRTPSTSSSISTKPILTFSTKTVTTPIARQPSDTRKSPGALLLARLSPATPKSPSPEKQTYGGLGSSSMLVTKRPQSSPSSSRPSSAASDKSPANSAPSTPTRLIKPATLPAAVPIPWRPSSLDRSDSTTSTDRRIPIITAVLPKKDTATLTRIRSSPSEKPPDRLAKSDSEDTKSGEVSAKCTGFGPGGGKTMYLGVGPLHSSSQVTNLVYFSQRWWFQMCSQDSAALHPIFNRFLLHSSWLFLCRSEIFELWILVFRWLFK